MMEFRSFGLSDVGRVRQRNEDASGLFSQWGLFVVADGMGGHAGGSEASRIAVESIEAEFGTHQGELGRSNPGRAEREQWLVRAINNANERILKRANSDSSLHGMGTTIVALFFDEDATALVGHVGDSRAYRLRDGTLHRLTGDHSVVAQLLQRQEISESDAKTHPYRHVLTQALGVQDEVTPDVARLDVRPGDLFVLCSDGVHGMIDEAALQRLLISGRGDPEKICNDVITAANAAGGKDNATLIAVQCEAGDDTLDTI